MLRPPLARPPHWLLQRARSRTQLKKIGVVGNGITRALAVAIRKKTLILSNTGVVSVHKTILCSIVRSAEILFRQRFDNSVSMPHPSSSELILDLPIKLRTLPLACLHYFFYSLPRPASSSTTSAVICHVLASRSDQNYACGERIPVPTALNIYMWNHLLLGYGDEIVVEFLNYGWPINYQSHQLHQSTQHNLPSALAFSDQVRAYIKAELSFTSIACPFQKNPLHQHLICSPLQPVPRRGSTKRHVVMDLSYPPSFSLQCEQRYSIVCVS